MVLLLRHFGQPKSFTRIFQMFKKSYKLSSISRVCVKRVFVYKFENLILFFLFTFEFECFYYEKK
jgi:hypothetical protein